MKNQQNWATNLADSYYKEFKNETKTNYWWLLLLLLVAGYLLAPTLIAQLNVTANVTKQIVGAIKLVMGFGAVMGTIVMWIETSYLNSTIKTGAVRHLKRRFAEDIRLMNVPPILPGKEGCDLVRALLADDFVSPLTGNENEQFMAWRNGLQT